MALDRAFFLLRPAMQTFNPFRPTRSPDRSHISGFRYRSESDQTTGDRSRKQGPQGRSRKRFKGIVDPVPCR
jgi:hypothetical protein